MGITGSIIVYVLIWWIIFFSVLPVGIQSNKEKFKEKIEGIDPGAPNNPRIGKKFLITTIFLLLILSVLYWFLLIELIWHTYIHSLLKILSFSCLKIL